MLKSTVKGKTNNCINFFYSNNVLLLKLLKLKDTVNSCVKINANIIIYKGIFKKTFSCNKINYKKFKKVKLAILANRCYNI